MKIEFKASFARDLKRIKDKGILRQVQKIIENTEFARSVSDLPGLKKLRAVTFRGQEPRKAFSESCRRASRED